MKKTLRRVLDRLRTATNGKFRSPTSVRGGLQEPQRMHPVTVPARSGSRFSASTTSTVSTSSRS